MVRLLVLSLLILVQISCTVSAQQPIGNLIRNHSFENGNKMPETFGEFRKARHWNDSKRPRRMWPEPTKKCDAFPDPVPISVHSPDWIHQNGGIWGKGSFSGACDGQGYVGMFHAELITQKYDKDYLVHGATYKVEFCYKIPAGTIINPDDYNIRVYFSNRRLKYKNGWRALLDYNKRDCLTEKYFCDNNKWYKKRNGRYLKVHYAGETSLTQTRDWLYTSYEVQGPPDDTFDWITFETFYTEPCDSRPGRPPYLLLDDLSVTNNLCNKECSRTSGSIDNLQVFTSTGFGNTSPYVVYYNKSGAGGFSHATIDIFDRWGTRLAFSTTADQNGDVDYPCWDGTTNNGDIYPEGTYIVRVRFYTCCSVEPYYEEFRSVNLLSDNVLNCEDFNKHPQSGWSWYPLECCLDDLVLEDEFLVGEPRYVVSETITLNDITLADEAKVVAQAGSLVTIPPLDPFVSGANVIIPDPSGNGTGTIAITVAPCSKQSECPSNKTSNISVLDTTGLLTPEEFAALIESNVEDTSKIETTTDSSVLFKSSMIELYPNPTTGTLKLQTNLQESQQAHIHIVDATGKSILQQQVEIGPTEAQIDMGDLSAGLYLVRVQGQGIDLSQKIQLIKR